MLYHILYNVVVNYNASICNQHFSVDTVKVELVSTFTGSQSIGWAPPKGSRDKSEIYF